MSQIATTKRRSLRRRTYIWMLSTLAVASALIYWEQTALLYAISTLAMCILLFMVAFANIEGGELETNQPAEADDASIHESNVMAGAPSPDIAAPRKTTRRKGAA
ncbi:MAG TPA: hypothetical protein VFB82_03295 [Blastocatellia bacterium]|nr:hypothetical protein [Blastocatellia bacterium]